MQNLSEELLKGGGSEVLGQQQQTPLRSLRGTMLPSPSSAPRVLEEVGRTLFWGELFRILAAANTFLQWLSLLPFPPKVLGLLSKKTFLKPSLSSNYPLLSLLLLTLGLFSTFLPPIHIKLNHCTLPFFSPTKEKLSSQVSARSLELLSPMPSSQCSWHMDFLWPWVWALPTHTTSPGPGNTTISGVILSSPLFPSSVSLFHNCWRSLRALPPFLFEVFTI